jgi:hypothetical protein
MGDHPEMKPQPDFPALTNRITGSDQPDPAMVGIPPRAGRAERGAGQRDEGKNSSKNREKRLENGSI